MAKENQEFGDILQFEVKEEYVNIVLKVLSFIEWATTFCYNAKYIAKLDTDTFTNFSSLVKAVELQVLNIKYISISEYFSREFIA